jgi:stage IV sporulation protein B
LERNALYTKDIYAENQSNAYPRSQYRMNRRNERRRVRAALINSVIRSIVIVLCAFLISVLLFGFVQLYKVPHYLVLYESSPSVESTYNSTFVNLERIKSIDERYAVYLFDNIKIKELLVERIKEYKVVPSGKIVFFSSDYKVDDDTYTSCGAGTLSFTTDTGYFASVGHSVDFKIDQKYITSVYFAKVDAIELYGKVDNYLGSLRAIVNDYKIFAYVSAITTTGVYGTLNNKIEGNSIPVALRGEIRNGKAQLITTIDGDTPVFYDVDVQIQENERKSYGGKFIITIEDEDFFEISRGILCGMSGSPIIQNGKLIGVVSHVLVYKQQTALCTFADEMLRDIQKNK